MIILIITQAANSRANGHFVVRPMGRGIKGVRSRYNGNAER